MMLREIQELFTFHAKLTLRWAEHDVQDVFEKTRRELKQYGLDDMQGKRVLDLGCGQRYAFALQCAAAGAQVTALDIDYVKPDALPLAFYRTVKHNGVKRAVKSLVRRVLWDGQYYRALEAAAAQPLRSQCDWIDFVVADPTASSYPLPSRSFDLIVSNTVLEHVADVPQFAREVARLLDSGGYFCAIIHNFYSISGGHNLDWVLPDEYPSRRVPPWDHLRAQRFPAWMALNRYRPEQFKAAFAGPLQLLAFDGVGAHYTPGEWEGEQFLTPEIAAELKAYPRELLLTRAWRMICRKA